MARLIFELKADGQASYIYDHLDHLDWESCNISRLAASALIAEWKEPGKTTTVSEESFGLVNKYYILIEEGCRQSTFLYNHDGRYLLFIVHRGDE